MLHATWIGGAAAAAAWQTHPAHRPPVVFAVEATQASEAAVPALPSCEVLREPADEPDSLSTPPATDAPAPPEPGPAPILQPPPAAPAPDWLHRVVVRPAAAPPPAAAAAAAITRPEVPVPLPGHNPSPDYPPAARRRGVEGQVVVRIDVAGDGSVQACTVRISSGSTLLDDAALRAARRWRFTNGPGVVEQPFRFELARAQ
ncbi:MAG: TonB family protein [Planctomycetes bacterium]|nr:TonB family protein [Planctomycetota bacterium]